VRWHISHPMGNRFSHPSHQVILYNGVHFCTACGATAVNKLIILYVPCITLWHGLQNYNLRVLEAGKAPQGFPGWPSKHLHDAHTSVVQGVQKQIDSLAASYMEVMNNDLSSYRSSRSSHVGFASRSD